MDGFFLRYLGFSYIYVSTLSEVSYASVTSKLTQDSVETYLYHWPVNAAGCCAIGA